MIGQKMNRQSGIVKIATKKLIEQRSNRELKAQMNEEHGKNIFHERYTKSATLLLIKERRSAF